VSTTLNSTLEEDLAVTADSISQLNKGREEMKSLLEKRNNDLKFMDTRSQAKDKRITILTSERDELDSKFSDLSDRVRSLEIEKRN